MRVATKLRTTKRLTKTGTSRRRLARKEPRMAEPCLASDLSAPRGISQVASEAPLAALRPVLQR